VSVGLTLVVPAVAYAQTTFDAGNEHYEQARLANGLDVYLAEDHRVPLVGISISYPVGKTLDPLEAPGAADLVAELLPRLGTRHLPDGPADLIASAGFYPWTVKATARAEETRVELLVPAAALDLALFLEADRMGFVADGVTTEAVEWGKSKVAETFRQYSGSERVSLVSKQLVFGPGHPYWTLGVAPDLSKVDLDWLRRRLQRFYGVAGAKLSIVGDIQPQRVMGVVQRIFGRLQGPRAPAPLAPSVPALQAPVEVRAAGIYSGFVWAWRTPRFLSDDDVALDVAARYLTHHLSQRLAVDAKRSGVSARQVSLPEASLFWLAVPVPAGTARASAESVARGELDAIAAGNVDPAELAIAKSAIISDIASDMDALTSRAHLVISYAKLNGKLEGFNPHLASYAQLDAARLAEVVKRQLGSAGAVITLVQDPAAKTPVISQLPKATFAVPAAVGQSMTADALEWYRPPSAVAVPRFDPPRIFESYVGKSRLLFMPRFGLPSIKLRVALNWQGIAPVPAVRGLVAQNLLRARPGGRPVLRDRLADLGATLTVGNDRDSLALVVSTLAEHADAAMAALREALEVEHFDSATFSKAREDLLKDLADDKASEWELANYWIQRLEYPASHRYHTSDVSDLARLTVLRTIDQSKLEAFWKAERRAEQLTVSIVGPVDEARARALAELGLPRFRSGKPAKPSVLSPAVGLFLVDAPAGADDDVRVQLSWPMPGWGAPGYADALGLRWLFGKGVTEELAKLLRDNGVQSTSDWFANTLAERDQAHLVFAVRVPKAQLEGVLKAVSLYVTSLQRGNMTWETVQDARREAVQWVTKNFEGASGCLKLLSSQADLLAPAASGSDLYLLAQRIDRSSLTKAAALLAPEKASVLAYGRVAGLETQLAKTAFGPARSFSAENPGKVR
jgi:zinc protease